MIGQGSRMIYQGLFQPGSVYSPNTFDLFFDWATLSICGAILFTAMVASFYRTIKAHEIFNWYVTCPSCGGSFVDNIRKSSVRCPHCGTEGVMDARDFRIPAKGIDRREAIVLSG
jgi:DNA-directed RNA polymerase subunit RPC12/RpoP